MGTKFYLGLLIGAAVALTAAPAAPELSSDSKLFFTGTAGFKYSDNIFLASTVQKASSILNVTPGVSLEMGNGALTKNVLSFSQDFISYLNATDQNTSLANLRYDGVFSDAKLSLKLGAGFMQTAQNSRDVRLNGIIAQTDITNVAPLVEFELSTKTSFGAGVIYDSYAYKAAGFTDRTAITVPLNLWYEVAPKLQGSAGYRYRKNAVDLPGADSIDHYLNVGLRGEFDPKLKGTMSVGFAQRKIDDVKVGSVHTAGRSESSIGLETKLDYAYSDKTAFNFAAKNDFANAATGGSQKVFEVSGGVSSNLDSVLAANVSLFYSNYKYIATTRNDDFYRFEMGVTYSYSSVLKLTASYNYQRNSSNVAGSSFAGNIYGLSAILRY
jgi:hypothetical protein